MMKRKTTEELYRNFHIKNDFLRKNISVGRTKSVRKSPCLLLKVFSYGGVRWINKIFMRSCIFARLIFEYNWNNEHDKAQWVIRKRRQEVANLFSMEKERFETNDCVGEDKNLLHVTWHTINYDSITFFTSLLSLLFSTFRSTFLSNDILLTLNHCHCYWAILEILEI